MEIKLIGTSRELAMFLMQIQSKYSNLHIKDDGSNSIIDCTVEKEQSTVEKEQSTVEQKHTTDEQNEDIEVVDSQTILVNGNKYVIAAYAFKVFNVRSNSLDLYVDKGVLKWVYFNNHKYYDYSWLEKSGDYIKRRLSKKDKQEKLVETSKEDVKPKKKIGRSKKKVEVANNGDTTEEVKPKKKVGRPKKKVDITVEDTEITPEVENNVPETENNTQEEKTEIPKIYETSIDGVIHTTESYEKWKMYIHALCKRSHINEGKLLSAAYKKLNRSYGIVYEQLKKDFYKENGYSSKSTLETIYWLEERHSVYSGLLESILYDMILENNRVKV